MANPWLRRLGYAALVVVLGPIAYLAAAFGLGAIAVTPYPTERGDGAMIDIAIVSDGIHTDIIVPVTTPAIDWRGPFSPIAAPAPPDEPRFVAIGWGHRGFYLNTPTWAELKPTTALSAILGVGRTVLHVTFLDRMPTGDDIVSARISPDGYARMVAHIRRSIATFDDIDVRCATASAALVNDVADDCRDWAGAARVPGHSYFGNDAFFEATGRYNLFYTCNNWTRDALAAAGLTVPLWSPFADAITRHLATETR